MAHITFSMAYVVVVVRSRLSLMDDTLEEAAMDLGGRPVAVFFDVTVPMLLPALVSGWLLSFTLSLDDLVISSFVSGPGATTLPMLIFAKVRLGVTPDINAITTIIIGLVVIAVATASIVSNRRAGCGKLGPRREGRGRILATAAGGLPGGLRAAGALYKGDRDLRARGRASSCESWLYVGHQSQVPERGDYFLFEMAGESVIVIRAADGGMNALLNVCRHRGSRICDAAHGPRVAARLPLSRLDLRPRRLAAGLRRTCRRASTARRWGSGACT